MTPLEVAHAQIRHQNDRITEDRQKIIECSRLLNEARTERDRLREALEACHRRFLRTFPPPHNFSRTAYPEQAMAADALSPPAKEPQ